MKLKGYFILSTVFLASAFGTFAQQRPQYTQYMINPFLLNPAVSGTEDYTDIRAGYRKQWTGFDGSPRTMYVSAHGNIGKSLVTHNRSRNKRYGFHGVGGVITSDAIGPTTTTTVSAAYSYHMKVSKKIFASLGLMGGFNQFTLDGSKLNAANPSDPLVNGMSKIGMGDITLGAWVYSDKFYAGASMAQLAPSITFSQTGQKTDYQLTKHYFIMAGYRIPIGWDFTFIPSFCIKATTPAPMSFDINAKLRYKDFLWAGVSYRNRDAVAAMAGVIINNMFDISYSYDYITSDIHKYTGGSHEIVIGYRLKNKIRERCPSNFW
ncbi:PorP/SprF family type IX secretion system membrane protein [Cytophaga aurantiaca]|uniref:PorP/SprF family type IX secretion system membrane protein n=1 Tax=Cytophaga aurantiaca TaxID=29530 RepID=UPI0003677FB0|nr:type IX secretion system membrane protein PorP/SprF [Cytophaga aurantiaca]